MTTETFTRAQLDAAVATARTEATAGHEAALATARTDAVKAERDRIVAITSLPEAAGREANALKFALNGKLSADEAKELLAGMTPGVTGGRASESPIGLSVDPSATGKDGADAASLWDKSLASRGMKVG